MRKAGNQEKSVEDHPFLTSCFPNSNSIGEVERGVRAGKDPSSPEPAALWFDQCQPGDVTTCPCGLEVEAAGDAVDV
jgi:hypothetical protein